MLRKIGQNYQIAIPRAVIKALNIHVNDFINIQVVGNKIVCEPQIMMPKDQAYFYTEEWQKEEKEAQEDLQKGRVTKTKNIKDLFKRLDE